MTAKTKLTTDQVAEIRTAPADVSNAELAAKFEVHPSQISRIRRGRAFSEAEAVLPADAIRHLPIESVDPDPTQPRTVFDEQALAELAASIRVNGLLQPITVRPGEGGRFIIIAGERRYRAHLLIDARTIAARVIGESDQAQIRVLQLIENSQRSDITPLEEARCYQDILDRTGWDVPTLAAKLGMSQAWRITERTVLLNLLPELQGLLASGNITPRQAHELAQLSPSGQKALFAHIKAGRCPTTKALRAMAAGIREGEEQTEMFPDQPKPSAEEAQRASSFERGLDGLIAWLNGAVKDNVVVAVHRVRPDATLTAAEKMAVLRRDLERVENAFRKAAAQQSLSIPA